LGGEIVFDLSRKNQGFTLIELAVVVAIVGIITSLAAPNMANFIRTSRVQSNYETLFSMINYARTEAVARGATVMVCHTDDPTAASPSCAADNVNKWNDGLIIYAAGGNLAANATYSSGSHTLLKQIAMNDYVTITPNVAAKQIIGFSSLGSAVGAVTPQFSVCHDSDEASGLIISLNAVGRMITDKPTNCDTPA